MTTLAIVLLGMMTITLMVVIAFMGHRLDEARDEVEWARKRYREMEAAGLVSFEPPAPEDRIARLAEDYLTGLIKLISDREQHHQKVMDGLLDRIQDPSMPARKALREAADEVLDLDLRDVDEAWLKGPGSEMDFDPDLDPRFGYVDTE